MGHYTKWETALKLPKQHLRENCKWAGYFKHGYLLLDAKGNYLEEDYDCFYGIKIHGKLKAILLTSFEINEAYSDWCATSYVST